MSEKITREIFDHMVTLAALELDEEQAEYLRGQLNNQLSAIEQLMAVPLDEDTPIAAHGVPYTADTSQTVRPDSHNPAQETEDILAGAPEADERHFVVPDIPHEDLD